jgi:hypothetical protein
MLCMGVTKSAPLPLEPSFEGKRMWVTSTTYEPSAALTPDEKCFSERPAGIADARAYIGYVGVLQDESLDPAATYVRLDGRLIGTASDFRALRTKSGIWLDADGAVVPTGTFAWTGATYIVVRAVVPGALPPFVPQDNDNCSNWTDLATGRANLGLVGYDGIRGVSVNVNVLCSDMTARLYCFEP